MESLEQIQSSRTSLPCQDSSCFGAPDWRFSSLVCFWWSGPSAWLSSWGWRGSSECWWPSCPCSRTPTSPAGPALSQTSNTSHQSTPAHPSPDKKSNDNFSARGSISSWARQQGRNEITIRRFVLRLLFTSVVSTTHWNLLAVMFKRR